MLEVSHFFSIFLLYFSFLNRIYLNNETCVIIYILEIFHILNPSLAVNQLIRVPPEELILPTLDGGTVLIPIPNSHIGKKPIQLKLLNSKRRVGMVQY